MTQLHSARWILNREVTEKEFQQLIIDLFLLKGWRYYHTYDSRRSQPGFPDLVLIKVPRLIFAELKVKEGRGVIRPSQQQWLNELTKVANNNSSLEVYKWTPNDWALIEKVAQ